MSNYVSSTGASGFVSPDEFVVCSLKNGYALNLISKDGWQKEDAVITNKRFYYTHKAGLLNIRNKEEIVDLNDITDVAITRNSPWSILITAIFIAIFEGLMQLFKAIVKEELFDIFLPLVQEFLPGLSHSDSSTTAIFIRVVIYVAVLIAKFIITRKTEFKIYFPTNVAQFSVKKYGLENVRTFQRSIFAMKAQKQNEATA